MPIIAVYYGSSSSDVSTLTAQSEVDIVILNKTNGPYDSSGNTDSNIATMVQAAHTNGKKAFGYVDSGGSNRPVGVTTSCSTTVSGSGCFSGISKAPSLCGSNPSGGVWNHWAFDSSEFNLGTDSSSYAHCYLAYAISSSSEQLRAQVARGAAQSGFFTCYNVIGYVQEQVDQWLSPTSSGGYGADGIWFDNAYVGSVNDNPPSPPTSNDPRYVWYKKLCDYVTGADGGTYSGKNKQVLLNAGNSTGAKYWYDAGGGGSPFFTYIAIRESDYSSDITNRFPQDAGLHETYGTLTNALPNFITGYDPTSGNIIKANQIYEKYLFALLKNASSISSTLVSAWYTQSCDMGIKFAYIATASSGGFGSIPNSPATISQQESAASSTPC